MQVLLRPCGDSCAQLGAQRRLVLRVGQENLTATAAVVRAIVVVADLLLRHGPTHRVDRARISFRAACHRRANLALR